MGRIRPALALGLLVAIAGLVAHAQSALTFTTIIRGITAPGTNPNPPATGPQIEMAAPKGIAAGLAGEVYVSDAATHTIRVSSPLVFDVPTVGGVSVTPGSADGPAAVTARFTTLNDIAFDAAGNAYLLDGTTIRRVTPDGVATTFAGKAGSTASSDGTGAGARFKSLRGLVIDGTGTLYAIDFCSIRRITATAAVTTLAGSSACASVDGMGPAAGFKAPQDLAIDGAGALYVAETTVVRKVSSSGAVSTLAGLAGTTGHVDATGSAARFRTAVGVAVDASGNVYVGDGYTLRKITPDGIVTTLAGLDSVANPTDGTGTAARFVVLQRLVIVNGTIYGADVSGIRAITPAGVVTTMPVQGATALGAHPDGRIFAVVGANKVVAVTPPQTVSTYLFGGDSTAADGFTIATARFNGPTGVAVAADGALLVADTGNHTIRRIANAIASTMAGAPGVSGSTNGASGAARFNAPRAVAPGPDGTIFVADTGNNAIRKITSTGDVTTIAGSFSAPAGVVADGAGNIYVADTGNHVIRKITSAGAVSTLAGSVGVAGSADGIGPSARFSSPAGVTITADGLLFVADTGNHTIRAVTTAGDVSTVGGSAGVSGFADGVAGAARFNSPAAVAVDASGTLFVADTGNAAVRRGLTAITTPAITASPVSRTANAHDAVQFTCSASGTPSPAYQWQIENPVFPNLFDSIADGSEYSGVTTPTLTVRDPGAALNARRFRCRAANDAGLAFSAAATLSVRVLTLTPASIAFAGLAAPGGGITIQTPPQTVTVGWTGSGLPAWTVSADKPWVHLSTQSGAGAGGFTVTVTDPGLAFIGGLVTDFAAITLTAADADLGSTGTLFLRAYNGTTSAPIGAFDTPTQSAPALQGALAVTGWALDDLAIDRVEIWRDPVAGESTPVFTGAGPGHGKIYIANALFVPSARPDVEKAYVYLPHADQAGWGYMLLTQGLWNQGNGTFNLYAFAFDVEGKFATLGTKTLTIDNASATKPFGTIDTPTYGGTVSGTIINFGWALTPGSTCSIVNPNVQVSIDSGPLAPVIYGDARSDVAGAFPGYSNAAAAGGHSTLDTTTLSNGPHTIAWLVNDTCGHAEGVGSRFFTVTNGSSIVASAVVGAQAATPSRDWALVRGTTESDLPPVATDGTRVVHLDQGERIEVQLPGTERYAAQLLANGVSRDLPIGSSFDASQGKFYWQPVAGFLGAYDLQFTAGSRVEKVRVVVGPPVRMAIDTPHAGNVLSASGFTVAGWSVDLASLEGAGIDTLHVWAYPVGGGAPEFVGVAKPGGARPDVAALYGPLFGNAGYTLTGRLAPGTYDLVVFAHSAASNSFAATETVRAIVR